MESVSKIKIKHIDESFKIKDSEAIKEIQYGSSLAGWKSATITEDGVATIEIPSSNLATSVTPGLVLISNNREKNNITTENGYLKAIVPIVTVSDSEKKIFGYFDEEDKEERNIRIPNATATSFGLVKVGSSSTDTILMKSGTLVTRFGKSSDSFSNIYEEEEDIYFLDYKESFDVKLEDGNLNLGGSDTTIEDGNLDLGDSDVTIEDGNLDLDDWEVDIF